MNVFGLDEIYLIDPVDAKSFDEFVRQFKVVRIALLLIKLDHLPLVDNIVGHLTHVVGSFGCVFGNIT